jgi:inosine-uridine nucleoside N-ribohydrolase
MGNVTAEQFAQAKENVIKLTKGESRVEVYAGYRCPLWLKTDRWRAVRVKGKK